MQREYYVSLPFVLRLRYDPRVKRPSVDSFATLFFLLLANTLHDATRGIIRE